MMMNASGSDKSDNSDNSDTPYDDMLNIVIASYQSSQQQHQEQQSSSPSPSSLLYKPIQSYRWKYSRDLGDDVMCSTCPLYAIWHYDHYDHHAHHHQQQQNGDDENSNGNSSNGSNGNVIRVDYNALFTERSCAENAGHASIMADHFFAELAYKMGMSDKYGA